MNLYYIIQSLQDTIEIVFKKIIIVIMNMHKYSNIIVINYRLQISLMNRLI